MPELSGEFLPSAVVLTVIGFVFLLYSGDCIVRGALAAAHKTNIAPILVAIVIVGFGTSIPEFFISIEAASTGSFGLAHGNIVGSNIANILLVIAAPAIIFPVTTMAPRVLGMTMFMYFTTVAWVLVTMFWGLNPTIGAGFLAALLVGLVLALSFGHIDQTEDHFYERQLQSTPLWRMITLILIGIVGLPLGSHLLIEGGIGVAQSTGISEEVLGLTLLAIGTSLPELGAALAASIRRQSEVAIGNILGSNIFNILGAGGAVALFGQQSLSAELHDYSHYVLLLSGLAFVFVVLIRRRVGLLTGGLFLGLYALYIVGLVQGWGFPAVREAIQGP